VDILAKDVGCVAGFKAEADAILVVNSHAPVSLEISCQFLQLVSRALQIVQSSRRVQRIQFSADAIPKLTINPARCFRTGAVVNIRGAGILE
jgi:hypothetical protein